MSFTFPARRMLPSQTITTTLFPNSKSWTRQKRQKLYGLLPREHLAGNLKRLQQELCPSPW